MRLPFPTRISLQKTFVFAAVVFVIQIIQHTDLTFAALFFAFMILSVFTFNAAGGFSRASGGYIFWFALLTCIMGVLWKIAVNEPGDSNLTSPNVTLATYVVSMVMIYCALLASRRLLGNMRSFNSIMHSDRLNLGHAALGCFVAYEAIAWSSPYLPHGNGSITSILTQENVFLPVCVLLGTIHTIRTSGGRKSVNLLTFGASAMMFFYGLVGYSKQAMFTPIVCWGIAASSQRYRVRPWQVALLIAFAVFSVELLSPLSQVGRAIVPSNADNWQRLMLSVDLLTHPKTLRADYYNPKDADTATGWAAGYYNTPQGLFDRLTILKSDDRLDTYTLQGHTVGKMKTLYYFIDWIPHFILPNKEALMPPGVNNSGNYYAHEVGMLAPDDYTTGISFSPSAEAFHMDTWEGIVVVGGFVWTLLFFVVDLICGDMRNSPIGLLALVLFAHVAPESLIGNLIYFIFFQDVGIIMAMVFCAYFAPIIGQLLSGPQDPRIARLEHIPLSTAEV